MPPRVWYARSAVKPRKSPLTVRETPKIPRDGRRSALRAAKIRKSPETGREKRQKRAALHPKNQSQKEMTDTNARATDSLRTRANRFNTNHTERK